MLRSRAAPWGRSGDGLHYFDRARRLKGHLPEKDPAISVEESASAKSQPGKSKGRATENTGSTQKGKKEISACGLGPDLKSRPVCPEVWKDKRHAKSAGRRSIYEASQRNPSP